MDVEVLVVPSCPNEGPALEVLREALGRDGFAATATVRTTVIETDEQARERGFVGSPTFLVDGVDPFADADAAVGLACRVYLTSEGLSGVPSPEALRAAFKNART